MIKSFLESVPELWRALSPAHSALLIKIRSLCTPDITVPILSLIRTVIQPDVTYTKSPLDRRNQRTFAVQPGISGMLDVSRQTYKELTKEIHQHVASINGKCMALHANALLTTCLQNSTDSMPFCDSTMAASIGSE